MAKSFEEQVEELNKEWQENDRWSGVVRDYSAEEVISLRGSVDIEYSLARRSRETVAEPKQQFIHSCNGRFDRWSGCPDGQRRT